MGELPDRHRLLFYEGLHGAVVTETVNLPKYADLLIGVVPSINLEWIQKLYRDRTARRHSQEAIVDTILRRMPDYVNYIVPQFSRTNVNFQRVPLVDTSNPFIARSIPTADESMLVIRFRDPKGIDFPYLLSMLHDSFMSRANTIVCPGGKMPLAMQLDSDADGLAVARPQEARELVHWPPGARLAAAGDGAVVADREQVQPVVLHQVADAAVLGDHGVDGRRAAPR